MTNHYGNGALQRERSILFSGLLIAMLAGCTAAPPGGPPAPDQEVIEVAIQNIAFPRDVPIRRGQAVRWTNREEFAADHIVASGHPGDADAGLLFESETMSPGESFTHTFNEVGEFVYFCRIHQTEPAMVGATVTVVEE